MYGVLNILLGYSNDPYATVGPYYFHFLFLDWVPMWVISLSLLYLMRDGELKSRDYMPSINKYEQLLPTDEESFSGNYRDKHFSQKTLQEDRSSANRESRNSRKHSDCPSTYSVHSGNSNGHRKSLNGPEATSKFILSSISSLSNHNNENEEKFLLATQIPLNDENEIIQSSTQFDSIRFSLLNNRTGDNDSREASSASESRSTSTADNDALSRDCTHNDLMMFTGMSQHNSLTFLGSPRTVFSPGLSSSNAVVSPTGNIVEDAPVSSYDDGSNGREGDERLDFSAAVNHSTLTN